MEILDLILALTLAAGAFVGLRRGLLRLVALVVGLAVGWGLGLALQEPLAARLLGGTGGWRQPVAFLVVVAGVALGVGLAARFVAWGVTVAGLGWLDRSAGAAAGLLVTAALAAAVLQAVASLAPGAGARILEGSRLAPPLLALGQALAPRDGEWHRLPPGLGGQAG